MAAGEYISMRSQREMFEYQIGLERDELDEYPEEEAEELALIYNARGMDLEEARRITRDLVKNHDAALDALAREELGLNPDDLGSPWGAAIFSFLAFSAGAICRCCRSSSAFRSVRAVIVAAVIASIALFGVGAALTFSPGATRGSAGCAWWRSAVAPASSPGSSAACSAPRSADQPPMSARGSNGNSRFICSNISRTRGLSGGSTISSTTYWSPGVGPGKPRPRSRSFRPERAPTGSLIRPGRQA